MLHHFHDSVHPIGQGSLSRHDFQLLIEYLKNNFHLIGARQWHEQAIAGTLKDEICLSFDDGLACQYDIALPVLTEIGIDAYWFIYSSVLEGEKEKLELYRHFRSTQFDEIDAFYDAFFQKIQDIPEYSEKVSIALNKFDHHSYLADYPFFSVMDKNFRYVRDKVLRPDAYHNVMSEMITQYNYSVESNELWVNAEKVKNLESNGHIIGIHSHTHPTDLAALPQKDQETEYQQNYDILQGILSTPITSMSHPCSSYTNDTLTFLNSLGIKIGFRATMAYPERKGLEYPREDHSNIMPLVKQ